MRLPKISEIKHNRVISHFFVIELGIAAIITEIAVRGLAALMCLFIFIALLLVFAYFVTSGKVKEMDFSTKTSNVIEAVYSIVSKYCRMIFPYAAILSSTFTVFAFTYGVAFFLLLLFLGKVLTISTVVFLSIIVGSFLLLYVPGYIKLIIVHNPFLSSKDDCEYFNRTKDFLVYAYDPSLIKCILNIVYVIFFVIDKLVYYQTGTPLISSDIDNVLIVSLVLVIALEGIRSTFDDKNITLSGLCARFEKAEE